MPLSNAGPAQGSGSHRLSPETCTHITWIRQCSPGCGCPGALPTLACSAFHVFIQVPVASTLLTLLNLDIFNYQFHASNNLPLSFGLAFHSHLKNWTRHHLFFLMELIREYYLSKSYSLKHTKTVEMANSKHLEKTVI